jgi:hypothetical protein
MELWIARELRMTRSQIRQISTAEFTDWVAFFMLEADAKKQAEKKRK